MRGVGGVAVGKGGERLCAVGFFGLFLIIFCYSIFLLFIFDQFWYGGGYIFFLNAELSVCVYVYFVFK